MQSDGFVPAKKRVALPLLIISFTLVFAFALILRSDMRSAHTLNPSGYGSETPEGFRYACEATVENGALSLRGWALVEGERLETLDNWVVLYDTQNGTYLRLPTVYETDERPTELIDDGIIYGRAGFTALVPLKQLAAPLTQYELCFAYRNNRYNALVHTGEILREDGL